WKRTPKDYTSQIEEYCRKCGCSMPLERRSSQDNRDDISEGNYERLKGKNRKIDKGRVVVHKAGEFKFDPQLVADDTSGKGLYPLQSYKDAEYRQRIAA